MDNDIEIQEIFDGMNIDIYSLEYLIHDDDESKRTNVALVNDFQLLMGKINKPVRFAGNGRDYHVAPKDGELIVIEAGNSLRRFFIWSVVDGVFISKQIDDIIFIWGLMGYDVDYKTYYGHD